MVSCLCNDECKHLSTIKYIITLNPEMTHFKDYYYYLKSIRWILNNSLANTTIGSSSIITSNIQKVKHLDKEETGNATIPDLEKWSEYKVKRLAEETRD
jgi:hypothetical protein